MMKRPNITKGDYAGHPFRGNQYTGGIYEGGSGDAGKSNPVEGFRRGLSAKAKKLQGGKKVTVTSVKDAYALIDYLHDKSVEASKQGKEAKGFDLCKVTVPGTNLFCGDNKGIKRIGMPQLGGHEDRFVSSLKAQGIKVKTATKKAKDLKATQNELVGSQVAGMMNNKEFDPKDRSILVSKDGYIVDGHHRWATQVGRDSGDGKLGDLEMRVTVIDKPILEVIEMANSFADELGLKRKSGTDSGASTGRDSDLKFYYSKPKIKKAQPTPSDVHVDGIFAYKKKDRKLEDEEELKITKGSGGLTRWFNEKWVDISRPKKGGGFEPCGRSDASSGKYPKCVPAAKAARMSEEQRRSAVSRKRKAESSQKREGKKPINVSTFKKGDYAGHPFRGNQHTGGIPDPIVNLSRSPELPARQRMGLSNRRLKRDDKGRYVKNEEWKSWTKSRRDRGDANEKFIAESKNVAGKSISWVRSTRGNTTLGVQEKLAKQKIRETIFDEWGVKVPAKTLDKLYRQAEENYLKGAKRNKKKFVKPEPKPKPKPDTRTPAQKRRDTLRSKMTRKERRESFEREQSRVKAKAIKEGLAQWREDNLTGKQVVSGTKRDPKEKLPEPIKISRGNRRGTRDKDLQSERLRAIGRKQRKEQRQLQRSAIIEGKAKLWRDPKTNKIVFRWIEPTSSEPLKSRGAEKPPKKGFRWASDQKGKPLAGKAPYKLEYNDERDGWEWVSTKSPKKGTGRRKIKSVKIGEGGRGKTEFEVKPPKKATPKGTYNPDKRTAEYKTWRKRQERGLAQTYGYKSMKGYEAARKQFEKHREYYIENPDKWAIQRQKFLSKSMSRGISKLWKGEKDAK